MTDDLSNAGILGTHHICDDTLRASGDDVAGGL